MGSLLPGYQIGGTLRFSPRSWVEDVELALFSGAATSCSSS